jgi:hypothetical protein
MKTSFPFVPLEMEIVARRRTEPFRFRVRTLLILIAVVAVVFYFSLPLSAADRRLMAIYETLGNTDPKVGVTKAQVLRDLGPPASQDIPTSPNEAPGYTWVADFETALVRQEFRLNLSFDSSSDDLIAWGLFKTEYRGLDRLWLRIRRLLARIGLEQL